MEIESVRIFDGKKYLWDGRTYKEEEEAKDAEKTYKNRFDVKILQEGDRFLVYTRKEVPREEVKVEEG